MISPILASVWKTCQETMKLFVHANRSCVFCHRKTVSSSFMENTTILQSSVILKYGLAGHFSVCSISFVFLSPLAADLALRSRVTGNCCLPLLGSICRTVNVLVRLPSSSLKQLPPGRTWKNLIFICGSQVSLHLKLKPLLKLGLVYMPQQGISPCASQPLALPWPPVTPRWPRWHLTWTYFFLCSMLQVLPLAQSIKSRPPLALQEFSTASEFRIKAFPSSAWLGQSQGPHICLHCFRASCRSYSQSRK